NLTDLGLSAISDLRPRHRWRRIPQPFRRRRQLPPLTIEGDHAAQEFCSARPIRPRDAVHLPSCTRRATFAVQDGDRTEMEGPIMNRAPEMTNTSSPWSRVAGRYETRIPDRRTVRSSGFVGSIVVNAIVLYAAHHVLDS